MSNLHIAAAAIQLTRKLFSLSNFEGGVIASNDNLEVTVHGTWADKKISSFGGFPVVWREVEAA